MSVINSYKPIQTNYSNQNRSITLNNGDSGNGTTPPDSFGTDKIEGNLFNTRSGGGLTKSIFGGIKANQMSKFIGSTPDINAKALLKPAGINMGMGAAVLGGISVIKQSIGLAVGHQDFAGAGANILTDVTRGAAAGLGATALGSIPGMLMKTSTLGTVLSVIGGVIGANMGANLVEKTGMREGLLNAFGSEKTDVVNYTIEKNTVSSVLNSL